MPHLRRVSSYGGTGAPPTWADTRCRRLGLDSKEDRRAQPHRSILRDSQGNPYGPAFQGGSAGDRVVFELTTTDAETLEVCPKLYKMVSTPALLSLKVGYWPSGVPVKLCNTAQGPLLRDSAGNLYGTTNVGGTAKLGTVFKLAP